MGSVVRGTAAATHTLCTRSQFLSTRATSLWKRTAAGNCWIKPVMPGGSGTGSTILAQLGGQVRLQPSARQPRHLHRVVALATGKESRPCVRGTHSWRAWGTCAPFDTLLHFVSQLPFGKLRAGLRV